MENNKYRGIITGEMLQKLADVGYVDFALPDGSEFRVRLPENILMSISWDSVSPEEFQAMKAAKEMKMKWFVQQQRDKMVN